MNTTIVETSPSPSQRGGGRGRGVRGGSFRSRGIGALRALSKSEYRWADIVAKDPSSPSQVGPFMTRGSRSGRGRATRGSTGSRGSHTHQVVDTASDLDSSLNWGFVSMWQGYITLENLCHRYYPNHHCTLFDDCPYSHNWETEPIKLCDEAAKALELIRQQSWD